MNTTKNQNGFTLIEMMIVVAIIAIMSAMLAPTLFNQVSKAEKARTASDIRLIESALKFYRLDNYRYPSQAEGLEALVSAPSGAASSWNGPYLESLPLEKKHFITIIVRYQNFIHPTHIHHFLITKLFLDSYGSPFTKSH